jgi:hypothetical protein
MFLVRPRKQQEVQRTTTPPSPSALRSRPRSSRWPPRDATYRSSSPGASCTSRSRRARSSDDVDIGASSVDRDATSADMPETARRKHGYVAAMAVPVAWISARLAASRSVPVRGSRGASSVDRVLETNLNGRQWGISMAVPGEKPMAIDTRSDGDRDDLRVADRDPPPRDRSTQSCRCQSTLGRGRSCRPRSGSGKRQVMCAPVRDAASPHANRHTPRTPGTPMIRLLPEPSAPMAGGCHAPAGQG